MINYLSTKGRIFNIQRFSVHDGPGIRTIIFLKGCALRCRWCCNPESQLHEIQQMTVGDTVKTVGEDVTAEEVLGKILQDRIYYRRSGGGVTLSGGEMLCQADFSAAILRAKGDTVRPLMYLTVAGIVNVALNLVFVLFFNMDVGGVALATSLSKVVSAILIWI